MYNAGSTVRKAVGGLMRATASSPLTIVDPTGRLTLREVRDFVSIVRQDLPLRVVAVGYSGDQSVFNIDLDEQVDYPYYDEEMNRLIIMFMQEYLPRGCEFTDCPEVWANQHAKSTDRHH